MRSSSQQIFFLVTVILCHCIYYTDAQKVPKKKHGDDIKKESSSHLTETEQIKFTTLYFNGSKEKILGNYDQAASLYSQCIRINPKSASAMYELAGVYKEQGKYSDALYFARRASNLEPGNKWFLLLLAECYLNNNLFGNAAGVYEGLTKIYPYDLEFYDRWVNTLLQMGKLLDAIKVYDIVEKKFGVREEITLQKQRIYIKLGKLDKAVDEINRLMRANPREVRYYELLSDLYRANSMFDKALETLNRIPEIDPANGNVHLKLADLYRSSGKINNALEELKIAFSRPDIDLSLKMGHLMSLHLFTELNRDYKPQLLELTKILVETHPDEARSHAIYGDYLLRERNLEDAISHYAKAIELDKNAFGVWNQLVLTLTDLKQYDELYRTTLSAIELFPTQPVFYLFNGIAAIQKKQYKEAIDVINNGLKLVVDNNALLELFYSNLGDAYYQMGLHAASDSAYDKTLQINPENAYVLNNYSYYLSIRKQKLEKAEKMSKKANELDPDNSAFQDTYGWILYGIGRFEDAKVWMEKAIESGGNGNGVILEHYGDVLFQLGEKEKAMEQWQKAKESGRHSPQLPEKIIEKKIIE